MFVFDTDHLGILNSGHGADYEAICRHLDECDELEMFVTIVSFQEQVLGWNSYISRAKSEEGAAAGYLKLQETIDDFAGYQVLSYCEEAVGIYRSLRQQRIRIGTMDLRIGAIALAYGMTVLTRNLRDFEQIPGLPVADWTSIS